MRKRFTVSEGQLPLLPELFPPETAPGDGWSVSVEQHVRGLLRTLNQFTRMNRNNALLDLDEVIPVEAFQNNPSYRPNVVTNVASRTEDAFGSWAYANGGAEQMTKAGFDVKAEWREFKGVFYGTENYRRLNRYRRQLGKVAAKRNIWIPKVE